MGTFVTVDVIIDVGGRIPLIKRGSPPFKGYWAIPGGIVEEDETVEEAAVREAREETGLEIERLRLLGVYSEPGRDPRGRSVTIAFAARVEGGEPVSGSDAADVALFDPTDLPGGLAFDHGKILKDYLSSKERKRTLER